MISIPNIPSDIRTPGNFTDIDGSGANQSTQKRPHRVLLVGHRLSTGSVAPGVPTRILGKLDGDGYFAPRSQIAAMSRAYKAIDSKTPLFAMGLDNDAGTAASGKITFGGPATEAGFIPLYVGGERLDVPVAVGDAGDDIAASAELVFDARYGLPLLATQSIASGEEDELLFVCEWKGPSGNDIVIESCRLPSDKLPAGVTVAITAMASGATSPSLTAALAAFGDTQYDTIVVATNDDTSLDAVEAKLLTRFGPMVGLEGQAFVGFRGTKSAAVAYGEARNSPFTTIIPSAGSPKPVWLAATIAAALDAIETKADPGYPSNGLVMTGMVAPKPADTYDRDARDELLHAGVSTWKLDANGQPVLERLITTYQKDVNNSPDPTFLDLGTMRTLAYMRWNWNDRLTRKYGRFKLANDGTDFEPGRRIATPNTLRGEALAWGKEMERAGYLENFDQFKKDLLVERNGDDVTRLDTLLVPDIVNQLNIIASKFGFRL